MSRGEAFGRAAAEAPTGRRPLTGPTTRTRQTGIPMMTPTIRQPRGPEPRRAAPPSRLAAALALGVSLGMAAAAPGLAQDAQNPFGSFKHDANQPIEITADSLAVDNAAQTATFTGKVVAGQGTLRLTARTVTVRYGGVGGPGAAEGAAPSSGTGSIDSLRAEGEVFLSNGAETAKGEWADYDVAGGVVTMGGNVVLTQGENAISGQNLRIDLNRGAGEITGGRVKSVFTPPASSD